MMKLTDSSQSMRQLSTTLTYLSLCYLQLSSGMHQIRDLLNANGLIVDFTDLFESPSALLKTDLHHKPLGLSVDPPFRDGGSVPKSSVDYDFSRCYCCPGLESGYGLYFYSIVFLVFEEYIFSKLRGYYSCKHEVLMLWLLCSLPSLNLFNRAEFRTKSMCFKIMDDINKVPQYYSKFS